MLLSSVQVFESIGGVGVMVSEKQPKGKTRTGSSCCTLHAASTGSNNARTPRGVELSLPPPEDLAKSIAAFSAEGGFLQCDAR